MASALYLGGLGPGREGHAGVAGRGRASGLFGELVAGEYGAASKSLMLTAEGRAELLGRSVGLGRGLRARRAYGDTAVSIYGCEGGGGDVGGGSCECEGETDSEVGGANG